MISVLIIYKVIEYKITEQNWTRKDQYEQVLKWANGKGVYGGVHHWECNISFLLIWNTLTKKHTLLKLKEKCVKIEKKKKGKYANIG